MQILRSLNLRAFWVRASCPRVAAGAAGPRRSFCALAVALPRVVRGSLPPARACFSWPRRCFGLPQRFSWPRRGSWLCAAQNFQAGGARCNSARRELEIIAEPLGLLHEALLSGRNFLAPCAQKLAATLCPCNILLAACQFVLFAARRFLQFVAYFVGRAARAHAALLSLRSICSVAVVWKLSLGSGPGWVGLRSKLLIDVAMKISMSQIL